MRSVLEPMAHHLGVDYDASHFEPPQSDAALVLDALRCGMQLMMGFVYADGWPVSDGGAGGTKRMARKGAKYMQANLAGDYGRDGISWVTQGYGRAMAALWRRSFELDEHTEQAGRMCANADRSEELAALVADAWPLVEVDDAVAVVASAAEHRLFDPQAPGRGVDLEEYATRVEVMAGALAIAVGSRLVDFTPAIIGPVMTMNLEYNAGTLADWGYVSRFWMNLLQPAPLAYGKVMDLAVADAASTR